MRWSEKAFLKKPRPEISKGTKHSKIWGEGVPGSRKVSTKTQKQKHS